MPFRHDLRKPSYHIPELVKCNQEACADTPKSLESADVDIHLHSLSDTAVELTQRATFMH